jgi:ABC-2 type transport system permease protein
VNRLLRAELNRLRIRRLTWVALVLVVLTVALLQLAVFFSVRPLSPAELEEGRAQFQAAQQDYQKNRADYEEGEKQCLADGNPADQCSFEPRPEDYASRTVLPFPEITKLVVTVTVFVAALALLFLGASFIGAEYSSGSLSNWLSFVPERGKVFASKLLALVLTAAVVTWALSALSVGLSALVSSALGAKVTGIGDLFEMVTRGATIGVIGAVVGFVLALVTRHTIAAAGTVLGYLLVSFVFSIFTGSIQSLQGVIRWLPQNNMLAILDNGYKYQTYVSKVTAQGTEQTSIEHTLSAAHGATYWAIAVVVLVGGALLVFRRRDVN